MEKRLSSKWDKTLAVSFPFAEQAFVIENTVSVFHHDYSSLSPAGTMNLPFSDLYHMTLQCFQW